MFLAVENIFKFLFRWTDEPPSDAFLIKLVHISLQMYKLFLLNKRKIEENFW